MALAKLIGSDTPVAAPKSLAGETLGSAGLVGLLTAILAIRDGVLAPTGGLERPIPDAALDHMVSTRRGPSVPHCLVNTVGLNGNYVSFVASAVT